MSIACNKKYYNLKISNIVIAHSLWTKSNFVLHSQTWGPFFLFFSLTYIAYNIVLKFFLFLWNRIMHPHSVLSDLSQGKKMCDMDLAQLCFGQWVANVHDISLI